MIAIIQLKTPDVRTGGSDRSQGMLSGTWSNFSPDGIDTEDVLSDGGGGKRNEIGKMLQGRSNLLDLLDDVIAGEGRSLGIVFRR